MKTTSILESIRNKMKKIENNDEAVDTVDPEKPVEPHDDFEYIDDTSKDAVESKHNARSTNMTTSGKPNVSGSDDDFDFLSEDSEEENNKSDKKTSNPTIPPVTPPAKPMTDSKPDKSFIKKDDDLDLDDINFDLEEDKPDLKKTPESKKSALDDLDLEDIDVDNFEPKEAPKAEENTLDLEKIFEEETPMPEEKAEEAPKMDAPKVETPKVEAPKVETPKMATPKMAEKNIPVDTQPLDMQDDDIFKDDELETPPSEPLKPQNNYQESDKSNMENLSKSTIISEEIAKQTSSAIKDIIKSVPKTSQNHQVLSGSSPAFKSGETIEEMVAALLAPKLEQWINENLPPMVEKIVRKEIKRLLPDEHE